MLAGIKDILIISTPQDLPNFENSSDGSQFGICLEYAEQPSPDELLSVHHWRRICGDDNVAMVLGDNIYYEMVTPI